VGCCIFSEDKLKVNRRQLKRIIQELSKWKAPATILLSLYIPPGRHIGDVLNLLRQELAITDNIKLKRTRDAVKRALSAAIDRLAMIRKNPENGLVVFSGVNVETGDFICLIFSPPDPVPVYFYRTDKEFHLEFLKDMVEESQVYGLILIERDQATIGVLKGSRLMVLDEIEDYIPGKHHKGGQSQRRFDRIIEQLVQNFYKKVAERAKERFLPLLNEGKLAGILIGGPGYAKYDFVEGKYLDYRLQSKILTPLYDVSYQGESGLRELVMRAHEKLKSQRYVGALKAIEEFKLHIVKDDGLAVYGDEDVKNALRQGLLKVIIVHEDRRDVDQLVDEAKNYGTECHIVNDEIPEGEWIKKTFNGIVGILRYKVQIA